MLRLNKPAYNGMYIIDLSRYWFKNFIRKILETRLLMYEIKAVDVYENFKIGKTYLIWVFFFAKTKFDDNPNALVFSKIKDETVALPIKELLS